VQRTLDVPYTCNIPHTAATTPAHPSLYGHGLLGDKSEANGGSAEDLRLRGFAVCAVDWIGMAFEDAANVASILADFSNFPSLADRAQQGFVNFMYLGRALSHPQGVVTNAAFKNDNGQPLLATGELYYDGNSQGAIMGGALTALAPDFTRASLGVPGMNYSTLLNRSSDWEGPLVREDPIQDQPAFGAIMYTNYPDPIDQQIGMALIQMLWDRAEANGYAHHMTSDPLSNTPAHQVMLQVAFGDHQVANISAEVEARTIGAHMKAPALDTGLHWSVDPHFGLPASQFGVPGESHLVYWFSAGKGLETPPNGNLPATAGADPHGHPRGDNRGSDQKARFLLHGDLIDVCNGGPCITTDASRAN
jgi:hypothetical protein